MFSVGEWVIYVKKNILFYVLLFICLFGFWMNSFAAKEPKYFFNTSNIKEDVIAKALCGPNSGHSCSYYRTIENSYVTLFQHPDEAYCDKPGDASCVTKFYVRGAENSLEQLKNYLAYSQISCGDKETCLRYTIDVYCKKGSNKSTAVCKDLIESDGDPLMYQDGNVASCSSSVKLHGADVGFSSIPITVLYDIKEKSVSFSSNDTVFVGEDSFSYNGNTFYLRSIDGDAATFKKELADKLSKRDIDSDDSNFCNSIFTFCCGSQEGAMFTWYSEVGTSCPRDKYYGVCKQAVGDDAAGIEITLSTEENRRRAEELLGEEVKIKTCADLFQGDGDSTVLLDILKILVGTVKVLVPAILLGLGSVDFAKAIIAQDDNAIKKAQSKFIRRLIIAVAIFLIPGIIKALLDIAHSVWPDIISSSDDVFCGIL